MEERHHFQIVRVIHSLAPNSYQLTILLHRVELFRAYEPQQLIEKISPTPLLMTVPVLDTLTPPDLSLAAYARAKEPKELNLLPGGHFDSYAGETMEKNVATQIQFLRKWFVH